MPIMKEMMKEFPYPGIVTWIGIRPQKKDPIQTKDFIELTPEQGIIGDHYHGQSGNRHVTLIQAEHIEVVGTLLNKSIDPSLLRRNIVVSGINLIALKDQLIKIGDSAILMVTGPCAPCSRMEENLGQGGYNAMRGHGGITAKVIHPGKISLNDRVQFMESNP